MYMPIYFSSGSDSFLNKWISNWGLFSSSWRTLVILTVQPFWLEFILAFIFGKCLYLTSTFERHLTGFKILHLLSFNTLQMPFPCRVLHQFWWKAIILLLFPHTNVILLLLWTQFLDFPACFQDSSPTFGFHHSHCNVLRCALLAFVISQSALASWDPWAHMFHQFQERIAHYFFKCFSFLLPEVQLHTQKIIWYSPTGPQSSVPMAW